MLILGGVTIILLLTIFITYNIYFMRLFKRHEKEKEAKRIEKLTKFYNNIKTDNDEYLHN
jgi:Na+-transporting methylmalonyl-CoA/oxaloacetate decarboxylase gamma subunit